MSILHVFDELLRSRTNKRSRSGRRPKAWGQSSADPSRHLRTLGPVLVESLESRALLAVTAINVVSPAPGSTVNSNNFDVVLNYSTPANKDTFIRVLVCTGDVATVEACAVKPANLFDSKFKEYPSHPNKGPNISIPVTLDACTTGKLTIFAQLDHTIPSDPNNDAAALAKSVVDIQCKPSLTVDAASVTQDEGLTATNSGTFKDDNPNDTVTISASFGTVTQTGTNSGTWSWSYATTDGPAQSQTVTITAKDQGGKLETVTFNLVVNNVAPKATFNAPTSVNEGGTISLSLTNPNDPSSVDTAAGFTYAFDCGSGYGAFGSASTASCSAADDSARTVKGKIRDKDGGVTEYTSTVIVKNVDPVTELGGNYTADLNDNDTRFRRTRSYSDVGLLDTHTATVDWGDGVLIPLTLNEQTKKFTLDHNFTVVGTYTVTVVITDDDGGTVTDSFTVTINPEP